MNKPLWLSSLIVAGLFELTVSKGQKIGSMADVVGQEKLPTLAGDTK